MSTFQGFTLICDGHECSRTARGSDEADARGAAHGWTSDGSRDFCRRCSERRAQRKKLSEIVPAGTVLLDLWPACEAAGFVVNREGEKPDVRCCGVEVETFSMFGDAYAAKCKTCGSYISDVTGPEWGNGSVAFMDSEKVDIETTTRWVAGKQEPTPSPAGQGGGAGEVAP